MLPLTCFAGSSSDQKCEKGMPKTAQPGIALPLASPANFSTRAFNLWTTDSFTLDGGGLELGAETKL